MDFAEFMEQNWLSVLMICYFLGMMLYGHYRGFIRLCVSAAALIFTLFAVKAGMPQVTDFLKQNTSIQQTIQDNLRDSMGITNAPDEPMPLPAQQRAVIENLNLPESIKETLIDHNNQEIYRLLGVNDFFDYVGAYITDRILNALAFVLLFLVVYVGLRLLAFWLNLAAKLPILSGLNRIAGALLGLLQALVFFWVFGLALNLFIGTLWGQNLLSSIEATPWVAFLHRNNLLYQLILNVIWNLF